MHSLLVNLLFAALFTRGLIELALPKKWALILQFSALLLLATLLFLPETKKRGGAPILLLLFTLTVALSAIVTTALHETVSWIPYVLFTGGVIWLFFLLLRPFDSSPFAGDLILWGWILFAVALLEQSRLLTLPGESEVFVIRAASLTGSFLHYPILIALIGFVAIERGNRLAALAFFLAPFAVASRSGALIVITGVLSYILFAGKRALLWFVLYALLTVSLSFATLQVAPKSPPAQLIERVLTAAEASALGNKIRIATWKKIGNEWLKTNLLIGEETGKITNLSTYTNAERGARWGRYNVSESSPLELLSNFGLIGCLLYYLLLFQIFRFLPPGQPWLRAGAVGALIQTLVYQSIEVIPFLTLLLLFPKIGASLSPSQQALSNTPRGQKKIYTLG